MKEIKVGDKVNFYHGSLKMPRKLIITEIKDNGILLGKCITHGDLWHAHPKQCRKLVKKKIDLKLGDRFIQVKSKNKIEIINLDYPWITYQRQENSETNLIGIEAFKEELRNGIIKRLRKKLILFKVGDRVLHKCLEKKGIIEKIENGWFIIRISESCLFRTHLMRAQNELKKLRKKPIQWKPGDRGIITYSHEKFKIIDMEVNYSSPDVYMFRIQIDGHIGQDTIGSLHCKKLKKKVNYKKAGDYLRKILKEKTDSLGIPKGCVILHLVSPEEFEKEYPSWNLETDKYGVMNFKTCWKCGNFFTNEHPSSNEALITDPPKYQHSECPKGKFVHPEIVPIKEVMKKPWGYLEQIECILCNSRGMFLNFMEVTYKKCPSCKGTKKLWREK